MLNIEYIERVRVQEQRYLRLLSGVAELSLVYGRGVTSRTDGKTILIDAEAFVSDDARLNKAASAQGIDIDDARAPFPFWRLYVRGAALHELFHVMFSRFDVDGRGNTDFAAVEFSTVANLIEDCFVNNAGTTLFPGTAPILRFLNALSVREDKEAKNRIKYDYSDFIYRAYRKFKNGETIEGRHEVDAETDKLFFAASFERDAKKRLEYAARICDALSAVELLKDDGVKRRVDDTRRMLKFEGFRQPPKTILPLYGVENVHDNGTPLLYDLEDMTE